jgi:hypothetical protein
MTINAAALTSGGHKPAEAQALLRYQAICALRCDVDGAQLSFQASESWSGLACSTHMIIHLGPDNMHCYTAHAELSAWTNANWMQELHGFVAIHAGFGSFGMQRR